MDSVEQFLKPVKAYKGEAFYKVRNLKGEFISPFILLCGTQKRWSEL